MRRPQKHCTTFGRLRRKATIVSKSFVVPAKLGFLCRTLRQVQGRPLSQSCNQRQPAPQRLIKLWQWEKWYLSQAFHKMTTLYNEYNLPIELQQETWFLIFYFCEVDWLCGQCSSWASAHQMWHINVRSSLTFTVVQFIQQVFCSQRYCEVQPND